MGSIGFMVLCVIVSVAVITRSKEERHVSYTALPYEDSNLNNVKKTVI